MPLNSEEQDKKKTALKIIQSRIWEFRYQPKLVWEDNPFAGKIHEGMVKLPLDFGFGSPRFETGLLFNVVTDYVYAVDASGRMFNTRVLIRYVWGGDRPMVGGMTYGELYIVEPVHDTIHDTEKFTVWHPLPHYLTQKGVKSVPYHTF